MRSNRTDNSELMRPTERKFWQASLADFTDIRKLAIAGLMAALSIVLQSVSLPLTTGLSLQITFFISAISGAVLGPLLSLVRGAVADSLGFLLFPQGAFYFGYTLSAMLSAAVYSLFLYRRKLTVLRVFCAKATVSVLINAMLGSVWSADLYGTKTYLGYLAVSLPKNVLLLPFEACVIILLLGALTPSLIRMKLIPAQESLKMNKTAIVSVFALTALIVAVLILHFFYPDVLTEFFGSLLTPLKEFFKNLLT